jgi:hypothetical protein
MKPIPPPQFSLASFVIEPYRDGKCRNVECTCTVFWINLYVSLVVLCVCCLTKCVSSPSYYQFSGPLRPLGLLTKQEHWFSLCCESSSRGEDTRRGETGHRQTDRHTTPGSSRHRWLMLKRWRILSLLIYLHLYFFTSFVCFLLLLFAFQIFHSLFPSLLVYFFDYPFKPYGNCMYRPLQQPVTTEFAFMCFVRFSQLTAIISLNSR